MTNKINKFDALAYATSKLGPPTEIFKNRSIEDMCGVVSDEHQWSLPCGRWLCVSEWSDGDQSTECGGGGCSEGYEARDNGDGSLCPQYEEQARELIDAYAEGAR